HTPGIVLISDGRPTDTVAPPFHEALAAMEADSRTRHALRFAIGIGRDADDASLRHFTGGAEPLRPENPHQVTNRIHEAMSGLTRAVSGSTSSSGDNEARPPIRLRGWPSGGFLGAMRKRRGA